MNNSFFFQNFGSFKQFPLFFHVLSCPITSPTSLVLQSSYICGSQHRMKILVSFSWPTVPGPLGLPLESLSTHLLFFEQGFLSLFENLCSEQFKSVYALFFCLSFNVVSDESPTLILFNCVRKLFQCMFKGNLLHLTPTLSIYHRFLLFLHFFLFHWWFKHV